MITYNKKNEPKIELNYSLNYKDYIENIVKCPMGYKIIKLGDYIEYKPKSKRNASYADETGTITFYTSSDKIKKCKECDFNDDELKLILGTGGNGSIFIDKQFSCSSDNFIITIKNKLLLLYLYYYIKNNWNDYINKLFSGSVIKHLTKERLNNYEIPIPINMEIIKSELEKLFELHETINEINNLIEIKENDIKEKVKYITENDECEIIELGSICNIWSGKNLPKEYAIKGIYNVYGGGNTSYTHNEYNLEGFNIIISRVGNNNIKLVDEKIYLTDNGFTLIIDNIKIKKYVGYYLINNKNKIQNIANGTAQKVISKNQLLKIKIEIPKNKTIIENLEIYFQEIENLKLKLYENENIYKLKIQELFYNFN
jgi:restriction endonuclease S subunit